MLLLTHAGLVGVVPVRDPAIYGPHRRGCLICRRGHRTHRWRGSGSRRGWTVDVVGAPAMALARVPASSGAWPKATTSARRQHPPRARCYVTLDRSVWVGWGGLVVRLPIDGRFVQTVEPYGRH